MLTRGIADDGYLVGYRANALVRRVVTLGGG